MAQPNYLRWLWGLALFGVTADLASKYAVFRRLFNNGWGGESDLVPGWFKLIAQFTDRPVESGWRGPLQALNGSVLPHVNHGALFGLGRGYEALANGFFAAVSVAAAAAIITWSFRRKTAGDGFLCAALGFILGGTLGNLFDRVVFHGVRDFMYFYWINWPVFNVADCCLVAGAGLLLLQALWPAKASPEPARPAELAEVP
jgi:lipoprotein signal peptidase